MSIDSPKGVTLDIDEAAIEWNTRAIAARLDVPILAVVKNDGYGHGTITLAGAALRGGATALGVTGLDDAALLRSAGITAPILSWMNPGGIDGAEAVALDTAVAVSAVDQLHDAARSASGVAVHLQLDTGMARDGAAPSTWADLAATAAALEAEGRIRVVGVMSHLGFADHPQHPHTELALRRFAAGLAVIRAAGLRPTVNHVAATSAALTDPSTHLGMVRIGAGLIGVDLSGTLSLRPAMRLRSRLVEVRDAPSGTLVGYGGTWTTPRDTRLGLVPLGYGDGLPRRISSEAEVSLNGRRFPIVGAVSMNSLVVDLGQDGGGAVADVVTVLGDPAIDEPTAADWAAWAGTIPQDILTAVGSSSHRLTS